MSSFIPIGELAERVVEHARRLRKEERKKEREAAPREERGQSGGSSRDDREEIVARTSPAGLPGIEDSAEAPKGVAGGTERTTSAPPALTAPEEGSARPTRITGAAPRG